ncbi:MAG: hypothetical protein FOGNACKC_02868 [Anaerolineae bacterium]|nr:hypothetical protein [Anaerolineae bacterium]
MLGKCILPRFVIPIKDNDIELRIAKPATVDEVS